MLQYFLRPLTWWDIEPRPRTDKIKKDPDPPKNEDDVINGRAWETIHNEQGFVSTVKVTVEPGQRSPEMDGWDTAYLRAEFKGDNWNQPLAVRLKHEWGTPDDAGEYPSNNDIVKRHTTSDGRTQEMYSLRNVKRYTASFNRAHKRRVEEENKKK